MTYLCHAGTLSDHDFDECEVGLTYGEALMSVLDALDDEVRLLQPAIDYAEGAEVHRLMRVRELYQGAIAIAEQLSVGQTFDVTIRDERYAVVPE